MTAPLSADQVAVMGEAFAAALFVVAKAEAGSREQTDSITQARDLYLRLGPYLLTEQERAGFPAADDIHRE